MPLLIHKQKIIVRTLSAKGGGDDVMMIISAIPAIPFSSHLPSFLGMDY